MTIRLHWYRVDNQKERGETLLTLPSTIGRDEENDLILAGHQTGISRFHATIALDDGLPMLHDTGSTNGIYVNKRRVSKIPLADGGRFLLGNYLFTAEFLVQCRKDSCRKLVSSRQKCCPWCGQFLADAMTSFSPFIQ